MVWSSGGLVPGSLVVGTAGGQDEITRLPDDLAPIRHSDFVIVSSFGFRHSDLCTYLPSREMALRISSMVAVAGSCWPMTTLMRPGIGTAAASCAGNSPQ